MDEGGDCLGEAAGPMLAASLFVPLGVLSGFSSVKGRGGASPPPREVTGALFAAGGVGSVRGVATLPRGGRVHPLGSARGYAARDRRAPLPIEGCFVAGTDVWTSAGFVPIERVGLGQRLRTFGDEACAREFDGSALRVYSLELVTEARPIEIETLRPRGWLDEAHVGTSKSVRLRLPEINAEGEAYLTSVRPAPIVADGPGCVVLSTYARDGVTDVLDLRVEGVDEVLGVTANHPIYSVDRDDWIQAGELRSGEWVKTLRGRARVREATVRSGAHRVYNLEVERVHVFHAGRARILVHNNERYGPDGDDEAIRSELRELMHSVALDPLGLAWVPGVFSERALLTRYLDEGGWVDEPSDWVDPTLWNPISDERVERVTRSIQHLIDMTGPPDVLGSVLVGGDLPGLGASGRDQMSIAFIDTNDMSAMFDVSGDDLIDQKSLIRDVAAQTPSDAILIVRHDTPFPAKPWGSIQERSSRLDDGTVVMQMWTDTPWSAPMNVRVRLLTARFRLIAAKSPGQPTPSLERRVEVKPVFMASTWRSVAEAIGARVYFMAPDYWVFFKPEAPKVWSSTWSHVDGELSRRWTSFYADYFAWNINFQRPRVFLDPEE